MAARRRPEGPDQTVHHESTRKKRRAASGGGMSLNMTPMIDVTFQLLIFFVVATNFTREGAIFSKLPETSPSTAIPPTPPITITVDDAPDGSARVYVNNLQGRAWVPPEEKTKVRVAVTVGGEEVPLADYLKQIQSQTSYDPERATVFIKPDPDPQWQYVLAVYNSTVQAGYKKINWSGD